MLKRLDEVGKITWASHVKEMLYYYGFGYVWIAHDVGSSKQFLGLFTQRLKDYYLQLKIKLRSFKSSEHTNEKGDGPYHGFGYLSLVSDPTCLPT